MDHCLCTHLLLGVDYHDRSMLAATGGRLGVLNCMKECMAHLKCGDELIQADGQGEGCVLLQLCCPRLSLARRLCVLAIVIC